MPLGYVVIGGGSGFVGSHLTKLLQNKGYSVKIISRMPGPNRMSWHDLASNGLPKETTAVVNLTGQNVLDMKQRWTAGFKQNVWNSRVNSTQALVKAISETDHTPKVFVLMTGVGIYEPSETEVYTESSSTEKTDFMSSLCHEWERAATFPSNVPIRKVVVRSGVVLGRAGGMIKQLYLPFFLGLGGPVASGEQYLPWIHIDDLCRLHTFAIENSNINGILNAVAPQTITNKEFSDAFASALNRPALIPVPEKVLNILLHPERAMMLTKGQRVVPERTKSLGFEYHYPDIDSACQQLAKL